MMILSIFLFCNSRWDDSNLNLWLYYKNAVWMNKQCFCLFVLCFLFVHGFSRICTYYVCVGVLWCVCLIRMHLSCEFNAIISSNKHIYSINGVSAFCPKIFVSMLFYFYNVYRSPSHHYIVIRVIDIIMKKMLRLVY